MTDLDSGRDDVPRHFRRTPSCGPERTCGADAVADVAKDLTALKFAMLSPAMIHTATALIGMAQRNIVIALERLDEERERTEADDAEYVATANEWHRRMVAAEAEIATLRHVHRPVEVAP